MPNQLFATKSIAELHEQESKGNQLNRALSATALTLTRNRRHHRHRNFRADRYRRGESCRSGPRIVLHHRRHRLHARRTVLRRIRRHDPGIGQRLLLLLRDLGEGVAWFIGWNLILEYLFAVATVSTGWSGYVLSMLEQFNIHLPAALTHAPLDQGDGPLGIVTTGAIINLPAMLIVAAMATSVTSVSSNRPRSTRSLSRSRSPW